MADTSDTASTAMKSFAKGMEVIGDNIANLNSNAFKRSRVLYGDNFAQTLQQSAASGGGTSPGSNTSSMQVGSGTHIAGITTDFTQGSLRETRVESHLGIEGGGYLKVKNTINGAEFATRNGGLKKDDRGYFVSSQGYRLQGAIFDPTFEPVYRASVNAAGALVFTREATTGTPAAALVGDINAAYEATIANGKVIKDSSVGTLFTDTQIDKLAPRVDSYAINDKGVLQIKLSNEESFDRGQVLLMTFADEQALSKVGDGLYGSFAAAGGDIFDPDFSKPGMGALGRVIQGYLETSNVDLTDEFGDIMKIQRSFQAAARMFRTSDEVMNEVVNLKR